MSKEFIKNVLEVMKFNIKDEERLLIQFVKMHEYGVATQEKPLLLTANLQSCIALIAYTKNFSFLAHMNVVKGNWNEDFNIDKSNAKGSCKKVEDLYNEILKNRDNIEESVNIGLVFGVTPVEKEYISRTILEKDLLALFEKLRTKNISAVRLPDISSFSFILDSRTGQIIHDGVENGNKITNIFLSKNKKNEENIIR